MLSLEISVPLSNSFPISNLYCMRCRDMFLRSSILLHQSLSTEWVWKHCIKYVKEQRYALINTKEPEQAKVDKNWSDPQWVKLSKKYSLQVKTGFQQRALILSCFNLKVFWMPTRIWQKICKMESVKLDN